MQAPGTPLIVEQAHSADAIAALLQARLDRLGFVQAGVDPLREALVHIGARYAEILIEQLNTAPARHRDVFLASLGIRPTPALPARVALSFTPVIARGPIEASTAVPVVVPGHTPVVAPPMPGDSEAVVFETDQDLTLVRAEPLGAWAVDPQHSCWADVSGLLQPSGLAGARPQADEQLFAAAVPIEPVLHIAAPRVLGLPNLSRVLVELTVHQPGPSGLALEWGIVGADGLRPLGVESDSTQGLTRSGVVVLLAPAEWPPGVIGGIESLWLSCRVVAPLLGGATFVSPRIGALRVGARAEGQQVAAAALCWGGLPLDGSKDYFPFGERPRFGELFHVMAPQFAIPGARIVLDVRLTNPADQPHGPLPAVDRKGQPRVQWETFTRRGWVALDASDGTRALTQHGEVVFVVPVDVEPFVLAGQRGPWVRARLVFGHYGTPQLIDGLPFPAAPSIASLRLYSAVDLAPEPPLRLLRGGVLELVAVDVAAASFEPFPGPGVEGPAIYLALVSHERLLAGRRLSFQIQPGEPARRPVWRDTTVASAAPRWQQRSAEGWRDCVVTDDSNAFTRPGIACVQLAAEPAGWPGSTVPAAEALAWLRILWPAGATVPRLRRLVLNAVHARQAMRLENEILGSSTGRPRQTFNALRTPIVGDLTLQVREAAAADGAWVAWQAVPDFSASDALARHFCLDPQTGQVRFGDGRQGRIPPAGANNIRLREYHVGGGRRGNVAAGAAVQLRTTVPYVQAVTHLEPAAGGQDAGDAATLRRAASAWLRHRDRAVCADDYVDLCHAASPEVARAWCIGCRDLDAAGRVSTPAPGAVSLVVLPHGVQRRPQPSADLLRRVKTHLDARKPMNVELVLLGPDYAPIAVSARVVGRAGCSAHEVAAACRRRLVDFLHPTTGGERGRGWSPGERPHRSDLLALLDAIEGVDHVVDMHCAVEDPGLDQDSLALALVCAGAVEVLA